MSNIFLGEIRIFAGNFAPFGWALCNGQILPISQYAALFSLLGTQFGGNGTSNFALPNLQGNVPMHWGNGAGLTPRVVGETGGSENVTLLSQEMPQHQHSFNCGAGGRDSVNTVANNFNGDAPFQTNIYGATADSTVMSPNMLAPTQGNLPHENMQPYLALTFIIALQGIFPSRN